MKILFIKEPRSLFRREVTSGPRRNVVRMPELFNETYSLTYSLPLGFSSPLEGGSLSIMY